MTHCGKDARRGREKEGQITTKMFILNILYTERVLVDVRW